MMRRLLAKHFGESDINIMYTHEFEFAYDKYSDNSQCLCLSRQELPSRCSLGFSTFTCLRTY